MHPGDTPDDQGHAIRNIDDLDDAINNDGCMRRIMITDSRESARQLALMCCHDMMGKSGEAIITRLADDIHALVVSGNNKDCGNGIPWITDLRETGIRLVMDGNFPVQVEVELSGPISLVRKQVDSMQKPDF